MLAHGGGGPDHRWCGSFHPPVGAVAWHGVTMAGLVVDVVLIWEYGCLTVEYSGLTGGYSGLI